MLILASAISIDSTIDPNDDCGDRLKHIATATQQDTELLGKVNLRTNDTYRSCRKLCTELHPNFQFYHKFIKYKFCECLKLVPGKFLSIRNHGGYTFGYAKACGKFLIEPCGIYETIRSYAFMNRFFKMKWSIGFQKVNPHLRKRLCK